jgi:hypothetical protein
MEEQLILEKEEKSIYRGLMDILIDGFDNLEIGSLAKELFSISLERVELKIESNSMKNKIFEDEDRMDDNNNW